jgi:hypothetical protein
MTLNGDPPTLTSEDFEFASADELFTFLGEAGKNSIRIRRDKPYVTVTAQNEHVRVYTHDSSDASVALLHRPQQMLDVSAVALTHCLRARRGRACGSLNKLHFAPL